MTYTIRSSAEVEIKKAPTIALAGPTGSGKTESALRIARGFVGPQGKFCVIDTEEKRALYKKARYQPWDWLDFQPPFSPPAYRGALEAAKNYQAVILDSGSHEWSGEGGCQDIQAEALERLSKGDAARAERLTALAWREPKLEHKKFMAQLIRYPVLLIVCLRAEPKIKFLKDAQGKMQIVDTGYQPICEKMFGYEMLIFAMMHSDNPGVPLHLKRLEADLAPVFAESEQITEETGQRLAQWAAGSPKPATAASTRMTEASHSIEASGTLAAADLNGYITPDDALALEARCNENDIPVARLKLAAKVERLSEIRREHLERAKEWINKAVAAKAKEATK